MRWVQQHERLVRLHAAGVELEGELHIPDQAQGLVLFAHGSGSSRHSPRNKHVAGILQQRKLGTLLLDLLTREEEDQDVFTGHLRFNIDLLAERVAGATQWAQNDVDTAALRIGYFGASTGAAAALVAAAELPGVVKAIVSRGGRPDLAGGALSRVQAPTLLIVGENDIPVIRLNHEAANQMRCRHEVVIVPGATHLFEEPGTLDEAANYAWQWFERFLDKLDDSSVMDGT